jgi:hypothetical protein
MPQFNQFSFQNPYMYGAGPGMTPPFRINAMNQPIAGQQTFQQGINAAQPQQGITPELQQVLDIIRQNQNYAGQQGMSQAQALAGRRGLAGSSIEQFGVQQANESASRAGQEQMANVLLQNVQRQQALQDLQTRGYFERAGQEASLGAQLGTAEGQLTSDEIASLRNIQLANQQMELQRSLGERGIDAQMANIGAQRDIAADEQRNALIGTGASLFAPYLMGGLFGAPGGGGGGGGGLGGLFGGGAAAAGVGGVANTSAGALGASSSLFPGGLGTVGTPAAGGIPFLPIAAGIGGALAMRNAVDKNTFGTTASGFLEPIFKPEQSIKKLGKLIKNPSQIGKKVGNAVKNVFRF